MNKSELVDYIAGKAGVTKKDAESMLNAFMDAVVETVKGGNAVTLTGFGTFDVQHRSATTKRNPRTGEPVEVPAKNVPVFRAGKTFKETVGG